MILYPEQLEQLVVLEILDFPEQQDQLVLQVPLDPRATQEALDYRVLEVLLAHLGLRDRQVQPDPLVFQAFPGPLVVAWQVVQLAQQELLEVRGHLGKLDFQVQMELLEFQVHLDQQDQMGQMDLLEYRELLEIKDQLVLLVPLEVQVLPVHLAPLVILDLLEQLVPQEQLVQEGLRDHQVMEPQEQVFLEHQVLQETQDPLVLLG